MSQSRYIRTRKQERSRKQPVRYVHGSEEEQNAYVRCWNCHNINKVDRLASGERDGTYYTDAQPSTYPPIFTGDPLLTQISISLSANGSHDYVVMTDPDNYAQYTPRDQHVSHGCGFCGANIL